MYYAKKNLNDFMGLDNLGRAKPKRMRVAKKLQSCDALPKLSSNFCTPACSSGSFCTNANDAGISVSPYCHSACPVPAGTAGQNSTGGCAPGIPQPNSTCNAPKPTLQNGHCGTCPSGYFCTDISDLGTPVAPYCHVDFSSITSGGAAPVSGPGAGTHVRPLPKLSKADSAKLHILRLICGLSDKYLPMMPDSASQVGGQDWFPDVSMVNQGALNSVQLKVNGIRPAQALAASDAFKDDLKSALDDLISIGKAAKQPKTVSLPSMFSMLFPPDKLNAFGVHVWSVSNSQATSGFWPRQLYEYRRAMLLELQNFCQAYRDATKAFDDMGKLISTPGEVAGAVGTAASTLVQDVTDAKNTVSAATDAVISGWKDWGKQANEAIQTYASANDMLKSPWVRAGLSITAKAAKGYKDVKGALKSIPWGSINFSFGGVPQNPNPSSTTMKGLGAFDVKSALPWILAGGLILLLAKKK